MEYRREAERAKHARRVACILMTTRWGARWKSCCGCPNPTATGLSTAKPRHLTPPWSQRWLSLSCLLDRNNLQNQVLQKGKGSKKQSLHWNDDSQFQKDILSKNWFFEVILRCISKTVLDHANLQKRRHSAPRLNKWFSSWNKIGSQSASPCKVFRINVTVRKTYPSEQLSIWPTPGLRRVL